MKLSDITRPTSARIIREQGGDEGWDTVNSREEVGDLADAHRRSIYLSGKTPPGDYGRALCLRLSGMPLLLRST